MYCYPFDNFSEMVQNIIMHDIFERTVCKRINNMQLNHCNYCFGCLGRFWETYSMHANDVHTLDMLEKKITRIDIRIDYKHKGA